MRPAPQGPDFHPPAASSGTSDGESMPSADVPTRRGGNDTYPSSELVSDVPDFIRPASRVAHTTPTTTAAAEGSASDESSHMPIPTEYEVPVDELRTLGKLTISKPPGTESPKETVVTPESLANASELPETHPAEAERYQGPIEPEFPDIPRELPNIPSAPPEAGDTADTPSQAGGGPTKPPTDPPVGHGATGPEGMRPADRYQGELRNLVNAAKETVALRHDRSIRVHTTGTVVDGNYDFMVVEEPSGSREEDSIMDLEVAKNIARSNIRSLQADTESPNEPTSGPPMDYHVDDIIAIDVDGSYASTQTVSKLVGTQPGEELLTVTQFLVSETETGDEMLAGRAFSRGEHVQHAEMFTVRAPEVPYYKACIEMFGSQGALVEVLEGMFATDEEAVQKLRPLVRNANEMGVYPREAIMMAVESALRIGLRAQADRAIDNGLRPDRLARVQRFVETLL